MAEILYEIFVGPCSWLISKWQKSVAELGHKFTSTLKNLRRPWHLSPFLQNALEYLAKILFLSISRTLMLIGIKMKKKL